MLSSARSMPLSSAPFINTQHPSSTYVTAVAPQEAAGTQRATGPRTVVAHPVPAQQYRTVKCQPIPMGVDLESAHTIVLTRTSGPRMRSGSTTMRCLPQKRPVEARTGSTPTPTLQSPEGCKRPKVQDEADPFEGLSLCSCHYLQSGTLSLSSQTDSLTTQAMSIPRLQIAATTNLA